MHDLVTLAEEIRASELRIGLDLSLALRKAKRPRNQERARKGWETRRREERLGELLSGHHGVIGLITACALVRERP